MSQIQLLEKLTRKLSSVPQTEEDIVFILSRIRKVLELNEKPERYQILKFYCDLALHPIIDRPPQVIKDMLEKVAAGKSYDNTIVGFDDLQGQLREFFQEFNLPNFYISSTPEERKKLYDILLDIYHDTPIITKYLGRNYEVKIIKVGSSEGTISFLASI
jgi:hypothetical protein